MTNNEIEQIWQVMKLAKGFKSPVRGIKFVTEFNEADGLGESVLVVDCAIGVVIAFRGSNDDLDWLRNIDAHATSDGRMHGFTRGYDVMFERIENWLMNYNEQVQNIYITGFSRGGALAQYLHTDLFDIGVKSQCCTFASPGAFVDSYQPADYPERNVHFINDGDPIEHLPPGYYNPDITYVINRRSRWTKIKNWVNGLLGRDYINYHTSISNYDTGMQQWFEDQRL